MAARTPVRMVGRMVRRRPAVAATVSPFSPAAVDLTTVMQMFTELMALHEDVTSVQEKVLGIAADLGEKQGMNDKALDETKNLIQILKQKYAAFEAIKVGPKGIDGLPGKSVDAEKIIADVTTAVTSRIRQPLDGKGPAIADVVEALKPAVLKQVKKLVSNVKETAPLVAVAPVDVNQLLDQLFEEIQSGKRKLNVGHIDGLDTKFAEVRNAAAMGGLEGKIYGKDTWARGGGDTVVPGTNVTFGKDSNGNKIINANPSGGFSIITVTGIVDDSNVTFGAATQPTLLNINGAFYQKTGGAYTWSYSGTTITLNQPVGTGGSIFGI